VERMCCGCCGHTRRSVIDRLKGLTLALLLLGCLNSPGGRTFRLVGFDTSETGSRARCESERMLGA
jgi:hypothetical protein